MLCIGTQNYRVSLILTMLWDKVNHEDTEKINEYNHKNVMYIKTNFLPLLLKGNTA
jgi:hypothetical protein